jgi:hypothetical protein
MQLEVRLCDAAVAAGGKAYLLHDAQGEMLPNQQSVVIEQAVADMTVLTVKIVVDGEKVRLA